MTARFSSGPAGRSAAARAASLFVFLIAWAPCGAADDAAWTLKRCYASALQRAESMALSAEEVQRAESRYAAMRARVLPQAGIRATEFYQDTTGVLPGSNASFTLAHKPEYKFYANQLLFTGFREFAAMKGLKAQIREKDLSRRRAAQLLYQDVAAAFYNAVETERRLDILKALKASSEDRLKELGERVRLGRSRSSEMTSARSQRLSLEADIEAARGLHAQALEFLSFLAGQKVSAAIDDRPDPLPPPPVEEYLRKVPARPDVLAAGQEKEASAHFLASARRGWYPTVSAQGNYYTKRTGFNVPIDWDVSLIADLPLFSGGQYRSAVSAARSDEKSASLRLARSIRAAVMDVRSVHEQLLSAGAQVAKLKEASDAAEESHRSQTREYRLGLVNNLDVLAALSALQQARLDHDHARLNAKFLSIRLGVAAGETPEPEN